MNTKKNIVCNSINLAIVLLLLSCFSLANENIITQGSTKLTFNDVDGFAFKMTNEVRSGFFEKPDRVEKLLGTMLNMKHVYNYLNNKENFDFTEINKNIEEQVLELFAYDTSTTDVMQKEAMFLTIKNFITIKESYEYLQNSILDSITDESVLEYAKEKYLLNKQNYQIPETRGIQYVSIPYSEKNQVLVVGVINDIQEKLINNEISFDDVLKNYKEKVSGIIVSNRLDNYTYSKKQDQFSDYVFSSNKTGILNEVLKLPSQILIVNIYDIKPAKMAKFDEVSEDILNKIKQNKAMRDFNALLITLTQDPININEENISSLFKRYQIAE